MRGKTLTMPSERWEGEQQWLNLNKILLTIDPLLEEGGRESFGKRGRGRGTHFGEEDGPPPRGERGGGVRQNGGSQQLLLRKKKRYTEGGSSLSLPTLFPCHKYLSPPERDKTLLLLSSIPGEGRNMRMNRLFLPPSDRPTVYISSTSLS